MNTTYSEETNQQQWQRLYPDIAAFFANNNPSNIPQQQQQQQQGMETNNNNSLNNPLMLLLQQLLGGVPGPQATPSAPPPASSAPPPSPQPSAPPTAPPTAPPPPFQTSPPPPPQNEGAQTQRGPRLRGCWENGSHQQEFNFVFPEAAVERFWQFSRHLEVGAKLLVAFAIFSMMPHSLVSGILLMILASSLGLPIRTIIAFEVLSHMIGLLNPLVLAMVGVWFVHKRFIKGQPLINTRYWRHWGGGCGRSRAHCD